MDEQQNTPKRPVNPRRRQRSKMQVFKEAYLPVLIAGVALLLIFIFIIGSIVRGVQRGKIAKEKSLADSIAQQEAFEQQTAEAEAIVAQATDMISHFDYHGALALIDNFSGNVEDFPTLSQMYEECTQAKEGLVLWNDPSQVLHLSLQILIADPARAYVNEIYSTSYRQNFITTTEFTKILQQLYENGYILVSLKEITTESGATEFYLPKGKKPLILTETNINYYTYMVDGDGDKFPDKDGSGFASKLVLDAEGNILCEMIDANGQAVTGNYDMVPILEAFVKEHPDFSYKGAKAILATSGYDGIFGYRTSPASQEYFGTAFHDQEVVEAEKIVQALRDAGYEFACYTYENEPYGDYSAAQIADEMGKWENEITPILGVTDIFVFSRNSDIAPSNTAYSGDKFETLQSYGYKYYIGFCEDGQPWYSSYNTYIRQGRILLTGNNLINNPQWFNGIFDPSTVLDAARQSVTES